MKKLFDEIEPDVEHGGATRQPAEKHEIDTRGCDRRRIGKRDAPEASVIARLATIVDTNVRGWHSLVHYCAALGR